MELTALDSRGTMSYEPDYESGMSLTNEVILRQISDDRALASAMLFPHRHRQVSPAFHFEVIDLWRSADEMVLVEAFREGAKTTISEEFLLIEALFGNFGYCLIFGETYTKACQRIEAMKHELNTNMKIYNLFGKQKGATWTENKIVLPNGVCVECHGWEEEIRGYKHLDKRPDRAYLDDIENKSMVRDTATVDANWKKLYTELIPAMDTELGKVRMTGTPLADDCMIRRAEASSHWTVGKFPICDGDIDSPDTKSAWPERYSMEWIRKKRDMFSENGMLSEFNQEYMLIATGAQGKPFTEDMLAVIDIAPRGYTPKVVIMDPARTADAKSSDQTGHVVVSRMGTRIYVHKSHGDYWQPDQIIEGAFKLSHDFDDAEVAIEKNSLDNWLLQPMRARMLTTGTALKMRALQAPQDRDKDQFIMGLQPFFKAGDIILVGGRAAHPQLVSQILNFPSGKKDILNALAYVTRVFSGVPVYGDFGQANVVDGFVLPRDARLLLGCNATNGETTAVLAALHGPYLTVLASWISPLMPADAVPDMAMLIRAIYPGREVKSWVPANVFDQVGRNPLVAALRAAGYHPSRGEDALMTRGCLSPMIRTTQGGRRLLLVDSNANHTLQALASGYNYPVKPGGERMSNPENNSEKTLIEGLECLTSALTRQNNEAMIKANAQNALGTPYLSALPRG